MARFQLDQNVSATLALLLRGLGHDVVTTNDAGLLDVDDDVQLLAAAKAARVPITHNREDFRLLHRAWRRWTREWHRTYAVHHSAHSDHRGSSVFSLCALCALWFKSSPSMSTA